MMQVRVTIKKGRHDPFFFFYWTRLLTQFQAACFKSKTQRSVLIPFKVG